MDADRYRYGSTDLGEGIWTSIEYTDGGVVARPTATYRRGMWVGIAFCCVLAAWFSRVVIKLTSAPWNVIWVVIVIAFFGSAIGGIWRRKRLILRRAFVVVYDASTKAPIEDAVEQIPIEEVEAIRMRENTGRRADDSAMWQTYLHVKNREYAVLVHQRPRWNREKELAVASELADRLGVPLIDG